MSWRRIALTVLVLAVLAASLYAWWWLPRRQAQRLAAAAGTPDQAALWEQLGAVPEGILRLPTADNPIARPPQATQPSQRTPPAAVTLPGVQNGGRLLATTENGNWMYSGPATVTAIDDVRLTLGLGGNPSRSVTIAVRVGGRALPVVENETVWIDIRERAGPEDRQQVLGIQTKGGAALLTVFETSEAPVAFSSAFGTIAMNVTQPMVSPAAVGRINATVRVGAETRPMALGERQQFGNLLVQVLATRHEPDPDGELGPYVLELVAWWPGP